MAEEFLDIVDENNELTGESAPRSKVHTEGLWHRVVNIFVFRKNNNEIELLVHLRSSLKDFYPDMWDTNFGGHVQAGLTLEEGARAELEEETGLVAGKSELLEGPALKFDNGTTNREFYKVYFFEFRNNLSDLRFNDGEVQKVKWMSIQEIKDLMVKKDSLEKWSTRLGGFIEVSDYLIKKLS